MRKPETMLEAVHGWLGTLLFLVVLCLIGVFIFGTHEYMKAIALSVGGIYAEQWNRRISS